MKNIYKCYLVKGNSAQDSVSTANVDGNKFFHWNLVLLGSETQIFPPVSETCSHMNVEQYDESEIYIKEHFPIGVNEFFNQFLSDKSNFWISLHHQMKYTGICQYFIYLII